MKPRCLVLAIAVSLSLVLSTSAATRTWTSKQGQQIQGKFVRYFDGNVIVLRANKVVKIPFEQLSEEDQDYVRQELEKKGLGDLLPPKTPKTSPPRDNGSNGLVGNIEPERTWTSNDGKQIRARLVRINDDSVVLWYKEREVTVPLTRLSEADQQYVKEQQTKREAAKSRPPQDAMRTVPFQPKPISPPAKSPSPSSAPPLSPMPSYTPSPSLTPNQPRTWPRTEPSSPNLSPPVGPPMQHLRPGNAFGAMPPSFETPGQVTVKTCGNCGRVLPTATGLGDKCPYCGVFFGYERDENGKVIRQMPNAHKGRYVAVGSIVSLIALVIGVLTRFLRS